MKNLFLMCAVAALAVTLVGCEQSVPTTSFNIQDPQNFLGRTFDPQDQGLEGQSLAVAGTGLNVQPSLLGIEIPVSSSADIVEAAFYWNGGSTNPAGDPTIVINGTEHTATLLSSFSTGASLAFFYKLNALDIVEPGDNTFVIEGIDMGPDGEANGIGLAVVYRDANSKYDKIATVDLSEYFYWNAPGFEIGDVHNFPVVPSDDARTGQLVLMLGDCQEPRADRVWWETSAGSDAPGLLVGGPFPNVSNVLDASDGGQWDTFIKDDITVPAGAGHFAFQLESPAAGNGDSGLLSFAAFCVPRPIIPPPPDKGCFWTIGFWTHQFNVATGDRNGNQHVSDDDLRYLLDVVHSVTSIDYDIDGNGEISFREADTALDLGGAPMCTRARQQFLATLLNYAWNGQADDIEVDTDYDGEPDMSLGDAIEMIESLIQSGDCEDAKDMADSINNMPECNPADGPMGSGEEEGGVARGFAIH